MSSNFYWKYKIVIKYILFYTDNCKDRKNKINKRDNPNGFCRHFINHFTAMKNMVSFFKHDS